MDVEPERARESRLGNQHAVGGDDDRLLPGVEVRPEPLGLAHLDPEPLRDLLRRRRRDLPAPALRPVGPREQVRDLVVRRQPLEHVGAERRRRGDGEPQGLPDEDGLRAQGRQRLAAGLGRRPVEDQDPVEVVELVLDDPRGEALELEAHVVPLRVARLDA